jgi:uncharacterized membrane protein HdeD (DUF308 family)
MKEEAKRRMEALFSKFWWRFVIRGFVAVLFGLLIVSWPGLSLDGLVFTFGIFALLQGILSLAPALTGLGGYFFLMEGVAGILAAVLTFFGPGIGRMLWPEVANMTLFMFIALWAFFTGIMEMAVSLRLPGDMRGKRLITLGGLVCLLLGLVLISRSESGAVGNASVIGLSAIVFGLLWAFAGFKARKAAAFPDSPGVGSSQLAGKVEQD